MSAARLNAKAAWNLWQAVLGEGQLCPGVQALCPLCRAKKSKLMPEQTWDMKSGSQKYFSAARIAASCLSLVSLLCQGRFVKNNLGLKFRKKKKNKEKKDWAFLASLLGERDAGDGQEAHRSFPISAPVFPGLIRSFFGFHWKHLLEQQFQAFLCGFSQVFPCLRYIRRLTVPAGVGAALGLPMPLNPRGEKKKCSCSFIIITLLPSYVFSPQSTSCFVSRALGLAGRRKSFFPVAQLLTHTGAGGCSRNT